MELRQYVLADSGALQRRQALAISPAAKILDVAAGNDTVVLVVAEPDPFTQHIRMFDLIGENGPIPPGAVYIGSFVFWQEESGRNRVFAVFETR